MEPRPHGPSLPPISEIGEYFGYRGALLIIDMVMAVGWPLTSRILILTMMSPTTFEIDGADATYSDPDTYDISSTNIGEQD